MFGGVLLIHWCLIQSLLPYSGGWSFGPYHLRYYSGHSFTPQRYHRSPTTSNSSCHHHPIFSDSELTKAKLKGSCKSLSMLYDEKQCRSVPSAIFKVTEVPLSTSYKELILTTISRLTTLTIYSMLERFICHTRYENFLGIKPHLACIPLDWFH